MNMITVLIVALVLGAYFYPDCPKMLKDNKQMLLGVFVGLLAGQYLGVKVEGFNPYSDANYEKVEEVFEDIIG